MILLNTSYRSQHVGTGTYTRNLLDALAPVETWTMPDFLMGGNRYAFWGKRFVELGAGASSSTLIHPYWATDVSRRHLISILDLVQYREATALERLLLRRSAVSARGILALSDHVAKQIWASFGRRCEVVPPFPDAEWYRASQKGPARNGPIRIAYWGGWHRRKNVRSLLATLDASRLGERVEIHCIGEPPVGYRNLRVSVYQGLGVDELVRIVDQCHMSIYPSVDEGFGLPVLESQLRARAVICSPLQVYGEFASESLMAPVRDWTSTAEVESAVESALDALGAPFDRSQLGVFASRSAMLELARRKLRSLALGEEADG